MINIDYSSFQFKIKQENNIDFIYDEIRKCWIVLTPEEWVRQNFIKHLTTVLQYPSSLIAIEKEIKVGGQKKRYDIVIYKNTMPWMIIECKQTSIAINDKPLQQILSYNSMVKASYFVITNGNKTYCWKINNNEIGLENNLPKWN